MRMSDWSSDVCASDLASHHVRGGQSKDTLITIAALQDGVTSAHKAYKGGRGGTGLQDMLDFIGELGGHPDADCDARVTIVSGKSCIPIGRASFRERVCQNC